MHNWRRVIISCFYLLYLQQGQAEEPQGAGEAEALGQHPEIQKMCDALTNQGPQPTCNRSTQGPAPTEELPAKPMNIFKDRKELEDYITCFFFPRKPTRYTNPPLTKAGEFPAESRSMTVQDLIEKSAQAFDLPPAFVACSYLKESTLDPKARSPRDCNGIAQINDNTYPEIDKIVKGELKEGNPNKVGTLKYYEKILQTELPPDTPQNKAKIGALMWQKTIAKTLLKRHTLAKLWREYFEARQIPAPTKFTKGMVFDPTYAIPAGALYFRYMASGIMDSLPDETGDFTDSPDVMQILAAASNWGPNVV